MAENRYKEKSMETQIEKHDTAAWALAETLKPVTNVIVPMEVHVKNAKEYVDSNQK